MTVDWFSVSLSAKVLGEAIVLAVRTQRSSLSLGDVPIVSVSCIEWGTSPRKRAQVI
jgi:hypothetical protein